VSLRTRATAQSLGLAQRIIIGFVQALDFDAVEAFIPDLKPRARSLLISSKDICDRFSRRSGFDAYKRILAARRAVVVAAHSPAF